MKVRLTINSRGAITIPVALRRVFGLEANDVLIAEETEVGILLRPAVSVPIEIHHTPRAGSGSFPRTRKRSRHSCLGPRPVIHADQGTVCTEGGGGHGRRARRGEAAR